MPKNVFDPKNQGEMNLKRNAYDLSKSSVFTTDFFKLYPHFCQEVIPGDTFEIDAQVGFRALPTTFPLQTRVRVSQEFYYCRDRTLQDDFEDMIFKTKEIEHPWLRLTSERAKKMISIGSLGDAFNVPCSKGIAGGYYTRSVVWSDPVWAGVRPKSYISNSSNLLDSFFKLGFTMILPGVVSVDTWNVTSYYRADAYFSSVFSSLLLEPLFFSEEINYIKIPLSLSSGLSSSSSQYPFIVSILDRRGRILYAGICNYTFFDNYFGIVVPASLKSFSFPNDGYYIQLSMTNVSPNSGDFYNNPSGSSPLTYVWLSSANSSSDSYPVFSAGSPLNFMTDAVIDSTDDRVLADNPFLGENPQIRLNVLPFRAYTQVANYYYRFDKNNPYVLNGEAQYNEFIPTHASGPDDNEYDFHYRNWELDRFTSALQSPQFGQAPLVGLIWTGDKTVDLTFSSDMSSDGESYKVTVGVDDGDNIESILDFSGDVPSADLQRLQRSIQAGLSINDIRVTNSFQRFLENVMRRGLRYRNQLKSHFGVSVDYPDIDIPQYIGGSSSYFDSGQVTNMAQGEAVLGDYNGTLQGGTATTNKIRCYCPEHGYIIGIVSITPIPSYGQAISKHMIKHDPFDYFTPEFGKIGFTPIHYSELSPLQNTGTQRPSDVFGYQKAWYDYMEALDEVHGDFRTTLRDFVLSRTFAERPQLSESFTVGSPDQLNDVFVTTKIADKYGSSAKFLGSARFHVRALRPIPMIGTPSLE